MARIIWLDDQIRHFEVMIHELVYHGHTVFATTCEVDALEFLESEGADLLIQDLLRPGLGGIAFLSALRRRSGVSVVPVVIVSAIEPFEDDLSIPDPNGGPPLQVQGWITKPFAPGRFEEDLMVAIRVSGR